MKRIGRLHILTDTVLQRRFSHEELTELAIAGGADTIQFRQKSGPVREMIASVQKMKFLCARRGAICIVNDRVDIALTTRTSGVHLGQDDFPIPAARALLGEERIIGGSASTLEEAERCLLDGADYIGFGPVFATTSKGDAGPASGIETLKTVVRAISLPIIAIGGIHLDNLCEVMGTGVHGIAVLSAVCCQNDPMQATRRLREAIEAGRMEVRDA